ncbi:hypothetical protein [Corynebacterium terpenotabidum]|uniref:Uncharacterized protein n=1 Tax=Corynebacterium terpenotabidum Y-11 TaxID=1200352 RepID=S4XDC6_9CORY|nr:hypothetical protein [Corynebacterium terpenotabidum]AGP31152.1 hypothetical protein A606_07525 [Corynebacterium terpenotabidum Y-11]
MTRLIAGGLCGLAVILAVAGNALWIPHALAGAVATGGALLSDRTGWWALVPWLALGVLILVVWF